MIVLVVYWRGGRYAVDEVGSQSVDDDDDSLVVRCRQGWKNALRIVSRTPLKRGDSGEEESPGKVIERRQVD